MVAAEYRIRKRELERIIGRVPPLPRPKVYLEQYGSPPHLVSRLLWVAAFTYDDIMGLEVADLGSGTGRIGLAAALLGARRVLMVEIDREALKIAWEWSKKLKVDGKVDPMCYDVRKLHLPRLVDVVVQNPPFGIHLRGADMIFLKKAIEISNVVYSIHKVEAVQHIMDKVRGLGRKAEIIFRETILIPWIYDFHTKLKHEVKVVAIRVS